MSTKRPDAPRSFSAFSSARDEAEMHPHDTASYGETSAEATRGGPKAMPEADRRVLAHDVAMLGDGESDMPDITEELLAQRRASGTTEERMVIALEMIADQIRSLVALLAPAAISEERREKAGDGLANDSDEVAWENEGGSLERGAAASPSIKHSVTDRFETGGYNYAKLADAIAEAKRARIRSASRREHQAS